MNPNDLKNGETYFFRGGKIPWTFFGVDKEPGDVACEKCGKDLYKAKKYSFEHENHGTVYYGAECVKKMDEKQTEDDRTPEQKLKDYTAYVRRLDWAMSAKNRLIKQYRKELGMDESSSRSNVKTMRDLIEEIESSSMAKTI